jgi:HSP20 family protein
MPITCYEPIEEFEALQELMNRSFEEFLLGIPQNPTSTSHWVPAVDIYETPNAMILRVELPGVKHDDVEIQMYHGALALKGKRDFPREGEHENYHRIERAYGTFERHFKLPESIDPQKITATFKDGVLTLIMRKVEEKAPQKITIFYDQD